MSIFPKRLVPGQTVTIHWNFNTSHLKDVAICPRVKLGVIDPAGNVTMLLDRHVMALPSVSQENGEPSGKPVYLQKSTPMLVLAAYLSGRHSKEKLVDILSGLQSGRHYYFTYTVPVDGLLGRYSLLSEVHSGGRVRLSTTAADDHFFVEGVIVESSRYGDGVYRCKIRNLSLEATPVKVVDHVPGDILLEAHVEAFQLPGLEEREVVVSSPYSFLVYNEEREMLPLIRSEDGRRCIRNQDLLELQKPETGEFFLLHNVSAVSHVLTATQAAVWRAADGIHTRKELRGRWPGEYDEMLSRDIIEEIL